MKQQVQCALAVLQWVSLNYYFIKKNTRIKTIKFVRWCEECYLSMILRSLISINLLPPPLPTKLYVGSAAAPLPHRVWQKIFEQKPDSFLGMKNHYFFHNFSKLLFENCRARYWFFAFFRSIFFCITAPKWNIPIAFAYIQIYWMAEPRSPPNKKRTKKSRNQMNIQYTTL